MSKLDDNNLQETSSNKNDGNNDNNSLIYIQPFGDENIRLPMTRRAAKLSGYLSDLIDLIDQKAFDMNQSIDDNDNNGNDDNDCPTIPLINHSTCNVNTMKNIIKWCEYHCDDPKLDENDCEDSDEEYAKRTKKIEEPLSYWDRRFLSDLAGDEDVENGWKNRNDLYDLLIVAHFLRINPIVEIGGKFICQSIRGKDVEQVRNFLGILNDFNDNEIIDNVPDDDENNQ